MTKVGGGEPKVPSSLRTTAPSGVTEAVPPHEPPSPPPAFFPLSETDRASIQADLDQQRDLLARHANMEPLTGLFPEWSERYWMFVREIARLERMLEDG